MLIVVNTLDELDFSALMKVYEEGNLENGEEFYPHEPKERQVYLARRDFEKYLREDFFQKPGGRYYIWSVNGEYVSALRLEPYKDGLLLEALETEPSQRRKGCGRRLIMSALDSLPKDTKVYSEVSKKNEPSLEIHNRCGFSRFLEYWVDEDGSAYNGAVTFRIIT